MDIKYLEFIESNPDLNETYKHLKASIDDPETREKLDEFVSSSIELAREKIFLRYCIGFSVGRFMRNNNTDNIIDNKETICKYADTVAGLLRPRKEELVDLLMSNDSENKDEEFN